jgi:hypothetical protein
MRRGVVPAMFHSMFVNRILCLGVGVSPQMLIS